MKGDFTRETFDPAKHFSRVLMQQGRVTLDADNNEQVAILLHYVRTLARDLMGPYAVPTGVDAGFDLSYDNAKKSLNISKGRCYVDGILVENEEDCSYSTQPEYAPAEDDLLFIALKQQTSKDLWLYLDVWERHISSIEEDTIREKALGNADTCTRAKVVWQLKVWQPQVQEIASSAPVSPKSKGRGQRQSSQAAKSPVGAVQAAPTKCEDLLNQLQRKDKPSLGTRLDPGAKVQDVCILSPDVKYRGAENQLYRVEIHQGGSIDIGVVTFKWSRDNGSVATAWIGNGNGATELEVTSTRGFAAGNWIELSDDTLDLQGKPGVLVKLAKVEGNILTFDPESVPPSAPVTWDAFPKMPKVRRWDQTQTGDIVLYQGAVPVQESATGNPVWIDLENGVQIRFSQGGKYRTGDYWLIPARVARGKIEWPQESDGSAKLMEPHGIEHHYAPLGYLTVSGAEVQDTNLNQCRCLITASCPDTDK